VSHVTVTVNAVDPAIGAQIYSWMRVGKKVVRAEEGAAVLLERQREAIIGTQGPRHHGQGQQHHPARHQ
jgi:nitrogen fixation protein NifB